MKKVLIILGIALFQLLAGWPVRAQVPVPEPARNMARLVLDDSTYVHVLMGVHGENGDFEEKDIFMPESMLRGTMDAYSRQTLDKVHLFGHFGYSYELGKRSTWRGWIDPYETPFMLADSIPGDISIERYAMQAGMAMPFANGWSAGLDLSYNVALLAKHKDLRNKNTGMDFRVAPGIHWQGGHLGAGLDLGYERGTEKVEYSQESSSVEHVLFSIYGCWVGQGFGFGSAETKRLKEDDRLFGDFQTDFEWGPVALHNNFRVSDPCNSRNWIRIPRSGSGSRTGIRFSATSGPITRSISAIPSGLSGNCRSVPRTSGSVIPIRSIPSASSSVSRWSRLPYGWRFLSVQPGICRLRRAIPSIMKKSMTSRTGNCLSR